MAKQLFQHFQQTRVNLYYKPLNLNFIHFKLKGLGNCICDLTVDLCDLNCCCDSKCSTADIKAFTVCVDQQIASDMYVTST